MILKDREYPLKAQILEAVLRRLPTGHPQKEQIENELGITLAGYHGEQSINYYLNFLPPENYLIMHDLRLKSPRSDTYFQIDTLILHPAFLLIIEVKNFAGNSYMIPISDKLSEHTKMKKKLFLTPSLR